MQRSLFLALIIVFVIVIFALQNSGPIPVKFFFWTVKSPVSLLLTSTLFIGGLFGILFSFPVIKKKNNTIVNLKSKIKAKEDKEKNK